MTTEKQTMTMTGLATALKHGKLELPEHLALEIPRVEPVPIGELVAAITDGVRRVLGPNATIHALWQTSTFEVPSGKGTLVWWLVLDRSLLELKAEIIPVENGHKPATTVRVHGLRLSRPASNTITFTFDERSGDVTPYVFAASVEAELDGVSQPFRASATKREAAAALAHFGSALVAAQRRARE